MRISELKHIIEDMLKPRFSFKETSGESLLVRRRNKTFLYFELKNRKETYLGKDKKREIERLEKLEYYRLLNEAVEKNRKIFNKILKLLDKVVEPDDVYFQIPQERRHLIKQFAQDVDEVFASKWSKRPEYGKKNEKRGFITSRGEKVRSKSELIIAERLIKAGVPYYYEYPVWLENHNVWYPDFLVLNKRTKQEYYWEHFGLMDDEEYCNNAQGKIEIYAQNNIILGKNLIISIETSKQSLNTEYVDKLIQSLLI